MDNIEDFLKETKFCDFSNESIVNLADKISEKSKTDKEFAVSAFYWVRDNILYSVGDWQRKASETLSEKKGTCTNKTNLLVALLRYKNIPAGYGVMKVHGQRYFGPIAIPMLRKFVGKVSTHVYAIIYLGNKWIKCDSDVDIKLSENTSYFNHTTKLLEWDGVNDTVLNLKEEDIIEDKFPVDNVDPWMMKESKNARGLALGIANIYINFIRNNTTIVSGAEEMEKLFKRYLKEKHFIYLILFKIVSLAKDIKIN